MIGRFACAPLLISLAATSWLGAAENRYLATWPDGSQATDVEIKNWGSKSTGPTLGKRELFDANDPVRTIRDLTLPYARSPASYVEFRGGDRPAGRVLAYVAERSDLS